MVDFSWCARSSCWNKSHPPTPPTPWVYLVFVRCDGPSVGALPALFFMMPDGRLQTRFHAQALTSHTPPVPSWLRRFGSTAGTVDAPPPVQRGFGSQCCLLKVVFFLKVKGCQGSSGGEMARLCPTETTSLRYLFRRVL